MANEATETKAGTLMIHAGARKISREALATLATPEGTATWKPVPHGELVSGLEAELAARELQVTRQEFAIRKEGLELFGIMDFTALVHGVAGTEACWALGIHTSNNREVALRLAVGMRVFVCDNLAFSGDIIALRRKHTSGLDLPSEISGALTRYQEGTQVMAEAVRRMQAAAITDRQAKGLMIDVMRQELVPARLMPAIADTYFRAPELVADTPQPIFPDAAPRTLWGLHNAFTRSLKGLAPATRFQATTRLGRFFGMGKGAEEKIAALLN